MNWTSNTTDNSLELTIDNETRVNFYCEHPEIDAHPTEKIVDCEIVIYKNHRAVASTKNIQDWPIIEKYLPRESWPTYMWAGQKYESNRNPDPFLEGYTKIVARETAGIEISYLTEKANELQTQLDDDPTDEDIAAELAECDELVALWGKHL